jgi:hypothetical protein
MPLTAKGRTILAALEKEYGPDKAKQVLYAGKNSGRFAGIDEMMEKISDSDLETFAADHASVLFSDAARKFKIGYPLTAARDAERAQRVLDSAYGGYYPGHNDDDDE